MKNDMFYFDTMNKQIAISSIKRDFPRFVSQSIQDMAKNGDIKKQHCYTNAYVVAKYLIENGYRGGRIVDGIYRCLRDTNWTDTHRFVQYTLPNGVKRYYDPTVEFVPPSRFLGLYSFEYKAVRVFNISEIERFNSTVSHDSFLKYDCMPSTLSYSQYVTSEYLDSRSIMPYINDNGEYVYFSTIIHNTFGCSVRQFKREIKRNNR